jgi:hypothetical protein
LAYRGGTILKLYDSLFRIVNFRADCVLLLRLIKAKLIGLGKAINVLEFRCELVRVSCRVYIIPDILQQGSRSMQPPNCERRSRESDNADDQHLQQQLLADV